MRLSSTIWQFRSMIAPVFARAAQDPNGKTPGMLFIGCFWRASPGRSMHHNEIFHSKAEFQSVRNIEIVLIGSLWRNIGATGRLGEATR